MLKATTREADISHVRLVFFGQIILPGVPPLEGPPVRQQTGVGGTATRRRPTPDRLPGARHFLVHVRRPVEADAGLVVIDPAARTVKENALGCILTFGVVVVWLRWIRLQTRRIRSYLIGLANVNSITAGGNTSSANLYEIGPSRDRVRNRDPGSFSTTSIVIRRRDGIAGEVVEAQERI